MNQRVISAIPEEETEMVTSSQIDKPKKKVRTVRMRYKSDDDEDESKESSSGDVITHLSLLDIIYYILFLFSS